MCTFVHNMNMAWGHLALGGCTEVRNPSHLSCIRVASPLIHCAAHPMSVALRSRRQWREREPVASAKSRTLFMSSFSSEVETTPGAAAGDERLAEALHHAQALAAQRLAAIVESSEDAIVSKDLDGIITSWNPAAEKMFGFTEREMIGQPITTIIPAGLRDDEARILATITRGERIEHFEPCASGRMASRWRFHSRFLRSGMRRAELWARPRLRGTLPGKSGPSRHCW